MSVFAVPQTERIVGGGRADATVASEGHRGDFVGVSGQHQEFAARRRAVHVRCAVTRPTHKPRVVGGEGHRGHHL